jgi:hypothetical protein
MNKNIFIAYFCIRVEKYHSSGKIFFYKNLLCEFQNILVKLWNEKLKINSGFIKY